MFSALFRKEIREHLMTFRFGAALLTMFVLVIVSVWVLGEEYVQRRDTFNSLSEQYADNVLEVYAASLISPTLGLPPSPLGIFAKGEERRFGNFVTIDRWSIPDGTTEGLTNNVLMESVFSFDLLSIFTIVLSLFGILFSYDSVTGERANGTLKMLCTGEVRRGIIFSAKFFGMVAVIAVPFLLSFLSALVVLQFVLNIVFTAGQWVAIGLMVLAGLTYGSLFIALGMLCSALLRDSSAALILSILCWAIAVLLIPLAGGPLAETIDPLPDRSAVTEFVDESARRVEQRLDEFDESYEADGDLTFIHWTGAGGSAYYTYDCLPGAARYWIARMPLAEELNLERAEQVWAVRSEYVNAMKRQAELASLISYPSPAGQLRKVFTALSGTSYPSFDAFMDRARRYRNTFVSNLRSRGLLDSNIHRLFTRRPLEDLLSEEKVQERIALYRSEDYEPGLRTDISVWEALGPLPDGLVPPMFYEGGGPDLAAAILPLGIVVVMALLVFFAGFSAFLRYDVR